MSLTTAVVAGTVVGVRHSLEADHLAAISALVSEGETERPGVVGTSWGIGHSVPILAAGLLFAFAGTVIPAVISALFEVVAGVVLLYLGVRMLVEASDRIGVHEHSHGGHDHSHLTLGTLSVGSFHTHLDGESFLVGIVHGLAGSGAVVVSLVTVAPTMVASLTFLLAFTVISVTAMGVLSVLWDRVLGTGARKFLEVGAGGTSVAIGLYLIATEALSVGGPL